MGIFRFTSPCCGRIVMMLVFCFFSSKIQGNKQSSFTYALSLSGFFFFGSSALQFDDKTCSPSNAQQRKRQEEVALHTATAVNENVCCRLQKIQIKPQKPNPFVVFTAIKVFTCLNNPNKINILHVMLLCTLFVHSD